MSDALQKAFTLLLLIVLGLVLRSKFKNKQQTDGIKEMVLSVALPSTIFIALMKVTVDSKLIIVPALTLVFNFFMYFITPLALSFFGVEKDSPTGRTLVMLLPSLAPGLSCFPFIAEFLGQESVAMAAMGDVGNKFFVLIFLYVVALNMFLKNAKSEEANLSTKIKSLLLNLVKEPINIIIASALILLSLGVSFKSLPAIIADMFDKTSAMMTPLVLIFIGLAVQLKQRKKRLISSLLIFRAGVTMLFSAAVISVLGINDPTMVLLAVAIPLSSASFWPFAHISAFNLREENSGLPKERRTFDAELAVLVLAFSLPFSTLLILGILSAGTFFAHLPTLIITGLIFIGIGIVPNLIGKASVKFSKA
ncbi:hypothetical protein P1X15_15670 [Runella sp. MFBS21]|uniref:hypothetical protein n=1 Tax=Runella sp. MFBS21 TaxID=3034018 RepID=UPI0023F950A8|nr:hypothetical protein [Runella sp. MFBS21]MDF7819056.1 hypothetical protein [Runella sp. MFBS21]